MAEFFINNGETQVGTSAADTFVIFGDLTDPAVLDGAGGSDTLEPQGDIEIGSNVTLRSIERLALDASTLEIGAESLTGFHTIVAQDSATVGNLRLSPSAFSISLDVTQLVTLNVTNSTGNDLVELRGSSTNVVFFIDPVLDPRPSSFGQGDDEITTGGGNDSLDGGDGTDTLAGGAGNDRLTGGIDFVPGAPDGGFPDSLNGGAGDDVLDIRVNDIADSGKNDDTFRIFEDLNLISVLDGGDGDFDTLDPQNAINLATAGAARLIGIEELALDSETLSLTASQLDQFTRIKADNFATDGALVLVGAGSASVEVTVLDTLTVEGTAGADTLALSTGFGVATDITVDAGRGDDTITTGSGADTLNGGDDRDTLDGGRGADTLNGGDGNDTLVVRDGDDANGGDNNDTFEIPENLTNGTTLDGGGGVDTLNPEGPVSLRAAVALESVEHLALSPTPFRLTAAQLERFDAVVADEGETSGVLTLRTGGVFADTLVSGPATLNVTGSGEDDDLLFRSFATDATVTGGAGVDKLTTVGGGDDTLDGGIGDDTLEGGLGDDTLVGGDDVDTASYAGFVGGGVTVSLAIQGFQDTINAGSDSLSGIENLTGGTSDDVLTGDGGANVIDGGPLSGDTIDGGGGSDTLLGRSGDDDLTGGSNDDTLDGGTGDDTLRGGGGEDTASYASATAGVTVSLALAGFQDTVGAGSDRLITVESLEGGAFADTLTGDGEANTLGGLGGDDALEGGGGEDTFAFAAEGGSDTVLDFEDGTDRLSFAGFGAGFDTAGEIVAAAVRAGADVEIALPNPAGGTTTVTVLGLALADLDAADFGPVVA